MDLLTEFFKKKVKIPHFPTHICLMVFCVCVCMRERETETEREREVM
jgi:hypothetical protein